MTTHPMEIDSESDDQTNSAGENDILAADLTSLGKAIPWVEKYRPQSLDDVAAHRDIVDTSKTLSLPFFISRVYDSSCSSEAQYWNFHRCSLG